MNDIIPKILIIEDELITAKSIAKSLISFGYEIVGVANSFMEGLDRVIKMHPDLILMDIKLKGVQDGITLSQYIQSYTDVPIIYLTAHSDSETVSRALHTSPYAYLVKPFDDEELNEAIRNALDRYKIKKE